MQISRKQVESYEPGHQIPSIQLQVLLTRNIKSLSEEDALSDLVWVGLFGTQPFCSFQIVLSTKSPIPGMWIWMFPLLRHCIMVAKGTYLATGLDLLNF